MTREALRAPAADKFDAPILADFSAAAHEYDADLARTLHMRPAAGLQIGGLNFDGAEDAIPIDFLSHAELRQLVRGSVTNVDRAILKDNLICGALRTFQNFLGGFGPAQVNRAEIGSEMEGYGRQAEAFLKHGRQKMLAGVLLHVVKPARPVDATVHFRIRWAAVDEVKNFVAFVADVEDIGVPDFAQIVGLATGRGVERRSVKNQAPDGPGDSGVHIGREHFAVHDPRGEFFFKRIVIIKSARGHDPTPLARTGARAARLRRTCSRCRY